MKMRSKITDIYLNHELHEGHEIKIIYFFMFFVFKSLDH